jgi:Ni/Co efflux regulator RcnB
MTSSFRKTVLAIAAVAALSAPAAAQGITIGPDGVRITEPRDNDNDRDRRGPPRRDDRRDNDRRDQSDRRELSERDAVRIARTEGLRELDGVDRTRSSYRVEGTDRRGEDIVVVVDRRSGRVLDVR